MAWGDIAAGLGGALQGGVDMYKWQAERSDRKQRDDAVNDLKMQLQVVKGEQGSERDRAKSNARMALQQVLGNQALDLQNMKGTQAQMIRQMEDQSLITHDQAVALNSMDVRKEIEVGLNQRAQLAADTSRANTKDVTGASMSNAATAANASMSNAGTAAAASNYNVDATQAGLNQRQGDKLPIDEMNAEANQQRARNGASLFGTSGNVSSPTFGGYDTILNRNRNRGQAPFQGPVDPTLQQQPLAPAPTPGLSPAPTPMTPKAAVPVTPKATVAPVQPPPAAPVLPPPAAPRPVAPPAGRGVPPVGRGGGPAAVAPPADPQAAAGVQMLTMMREITAMPPGPAKTAAIAKLVALRAQAEALKTKR